MQNKTGILIVMAAGLIISACSNPPGSGQVSPSPSVSPVAASPKPDPQTEIKLIEYGTSFGHCIGYCMREWEITAGKIVYKKTSREPETNPDVVREIKITAEQWNELVKATNLNSFKSLPETIGCPDCAD